MTKKILRTQYQHARSLLSNQEIAQYSQDITRQFRNLVLPDYQCCHIFMTIKKQKEVDTSYLIAELLAHNKTIVLPRCSPTSLAMTHHQLTDQTVFDEATYHIPQPTNGPLIAPHLLDIVFVPLLVFDLNGNRIGYGKGYYDVFLGQCPPTTLKIGLSFFEAEQHPIETSTTDIALDYCLTPFKQYHFTRN